MWENLNCMLNQWKKWYLEGKNIQRKNSMVKPNSFVSWCLMRIWTTYTCWTDKIVWMSSRNVCIMRNTAYNYNSFLVGANNLNLWVGLPLLTWMLTLQSSCSSSFTLISEPQTVWLWLLNYSYEGFLNLFCLRWTNVPLKIQAWLETQSKNVFTCSKLYVLWYCCDCIMLFTGVMW